MEAEIFSVLFIRIKLYYIGNKFDFCKMMIIIIIVVLLREIIRFTRISIDFTNYLLIIHIISNFLHFYSFNFYSFE